MKILLISGHSKSSVGSVGNGYKEYTITREFAKLIKNNLSAHAEVYLYNADREDLNAYDRVATNINDFKGFDYILEIHFNAGGGTGSEIYITSSETGKSVETTIVNKLSNFYKNRGVKVYDYYVIKTIKNKLNISCALLEVCFIDSANDMAIYASHKDTLAKLVSDGIVEGFGLDQTATNTTQPTETPTISDTTNTTNTATVASNGDSTIKSIQSTLNSRYGFNLDVDGIFGNLTKTALVKALQREIGTTADGIFGINTYTVCGNKTNLKNGSSGKLVYILQATLYCLGFDCKGIDSIFGANTQSAVKAYQQAKGLTVDGIAGKNTFAKLFGYK